MHQKKTKSSYWESFSISPAKPEAPETVAKLDTNLGWNELPVHMVISRNDQSKNWGGKRLQGNHRCLTRISAVYSTTKICLCTPNRSSSTENVSTSSRVLLERHYFLTIKPTSTPMQISPKQCMGSPPNLNCPSLTLDSTHGACCLLLGMSITPRYF